MVVRRGKRNQVVNYHPRAIDEFKACVGEPVLKTKMSKNDASAFDRARRKLGIAD